MPESLTVEEYRRQLRGGARRKPPNKFHAQPAEADGIKFGSKKEARRWGQLKLLESLGRIKELRAHPSFRLVVHGVEVGEYTADNSYLDVTTGKYVVEDVKSKVTRTEAYRLRKLLMKALFQIDILEI